jgi:hypothetical protein
MTPNIISTLSSSKTTVSILLAPLFLLGCAGVAPETLRPPAREAVLHLKEQVSWKRASWDVTLRSGLYVAKYENDEGTYFIGPKPCLYMSMGTTSAEPAGAAWECGIFVPNMKVSPPIVLMVLGTNHEHKGFHPDGTPFISEENQGNEEKANYVDTSNLTPQTSGFSGVAGGAIGGGIANGIVAAERGRFQVFTTQPPNGWFQRAISD